MDAETMWFVEAVTKYLREMASRGDQQAAQLFEEAVALLEGDEEEDGPDFVEITDTHLEHMKLWSGEPNLSIPDMVKSVEFLQEILRITKKEPDQ